MYIMKFVTGVAGDTCCTTVENAFSNIVTQTHVDSKNLLVQLNQYFKITLLYLVGLKRIFALFER